MRSSILSAIPALLFSMACGDDGGSGGAAGTGSSTSSTTSGQSTTGSGTTGTGTSASTTATGTGGAGGDASGGGGAGGDGTGGGGGGIGNCNEVVASNIALATALGCADNSGPLQTFCESLYNMNMCTTEWEALHDCLSTKPISDFECDATMGGVVDPKDGVCAAERTAFVACL